MPFKFDHSAICKECPFGKCIEDRRKNPVPGRKTQFRLKQSTALHCSFEENAPGAPDDTLSELTFDELLGQFRQNALEAGSLLYGPQFSLSPSALAKVEGDVFELLEAAALWNACATWNQHMDGGDWNSGTFKIPDKTIQTPSRKVAVLWLPRGYDTTKLFRDDVRKEVLAFEASMQRQDMELGLSAPDLVGIRLPDLGDDVLEVFKQPITNLKTANRELLEGAYKELEGTLEGRSFLFAVAIKRTTRSDRLYQPLFEANILKFLIEVVLKGAAFRFYVHMGSFEGADVVGHYKAASLISLMRGGNVARAIDDTYHAIRPVETAQKILDDFTLFPL